MSIHGKVTFFLPDLSGGGAEKSVLGLLKELTGRGMRPDLVLAKAQGEYLSSLPAGVRMEDLGAGRVAGALWPLVRYLKKNRPAVIISHLRHANLICLMAAAIAGTDTRVIVVEHSVLVEQKRKAMVVGMEKQKRQARGKEGWLPWLMKKLYWRADAIVAVSPGTARNIEKGLGFPAGRIRTLYNPVVEPSVFEQAAAPADHPWLKDRMPGAAGKEGGAGAEREAPVFLAVGRLSPEKGLDVLLDALGLVKQKIAGARLILIGEGRERSRLEREIAARGLGEGVSMPGFVRNPYAFLSRADALVLSSWQEAFPTVLIEALACGCPVISTDCPVGPAEILQGGTLGTLVPTGDERALAAAMIEEYENRRNGNERKEAGLRRAREFSAEASGDGWLSLIDEVTAPRVLHIITGLSLGGAETMLAGLVTWMPSPGDSMEKEPGEDRLIPAIPWRHEVLSLGGEGSVAGRLRDAGIPVHSLGMRPGWPPTPGALWRMRRLLRRVRPRLIQGWMYHGNLAASFARRFGRSREERDRGGGSSKKLPVVWGIHHSIGSLEKEKASTRAVIRWGARFSERPEAIVYVSNNSREQHKQLGYCDLRARLIPNGIDGRQFSPSREGRKNVLELLGLEESGPASPSASASASPTASPLLIGHFARYHPMKDHVNLLRAAALFIHKDEIPGRPAGSRRLPPVHFVLGGTGVDAENRELGALVQSLGIGNRVHLLGERKDLDLVLPGLDIFCLSSAYGEALPVVLLEAMSCGIPCVATAVGDAALVIGETGGLAAPGDPEALATALEKLADMEEEARRALGMAARKRALAHYSLGRMAKGYEKLYRELTGSVQV